MSKTSGYNNCIVECDNCGRMEHYCTSSYSEVNDMLRDIDWKVMKIDNNWVDFCCGKCYGEYYYGIHNEYPNEYEDEYQQDYPIIDDTEDDIDYLNDDFWNNTDILLDIEEKNKKPDILANLDKAVAETKKNNKKNDKENNDIKSNKKSENKLYPKETKLRYELTREYFRNVEKEMRDRGTKIKGRSSSMDVITVTVAMNIVKKYIGEHCDKLIEGTKDIYCDNEGK